MPLRGKILNTWEVSSDEVLASQEVHDISVAIGMDPDSDDLSQLRYGKICILADADSDGLHIATLLCALFVRHLPGNAGPEVSFFLTTFLAARIRRCALLIAISASNSPT